jgi:CHASE3 domain sensor protein
VNWFNAVLVIVIAALCEFALPVVFSLIALLVVVWTAQVWLRRRRAVQAGRARVVEAVADARAEMDAAAERQAFLDNCRTARLTNVIPQQRGPE